MRVVIQRVSQASVVTGSYRKAAIGAGFLVLLGIESGDTEKDAGWFVKKIAGLRIFSDENGLMNNNINDTDGEILVVSQFTLHASYKKGNRPSFIKAARPEQAVPLYEYFIKQLEVATGKPVATGIFGAAMKVNLVNDGPVTICMDSRQPE